MNLFRNVTAAAALMFASHANAAQLEWAGHWEGTIVSHRKALPVSFDFSRNAQGPEGRFTSLSQAAMDYPLDKVGLDRGHMTFVLGGSLAFDGTFNGGKIIGTLKSGETPGIFMLRRAAPPHLPYDTREVSFRNANITLKGTLCLPRTPGRHAAVVLLHGSGAQSRWGTERYIADRFARAGIAALIYDKRGSGDSGGDWRTARYEDLARDALAGVKLLASRSDIDFRRIGLLGHSQGGVIGPLAATLAPDRIGFIVAEDTFAGPQKDQDIYRVHNALHELNLAPDDYRKAMEVYSLFVDAARGARTFAEFYKASSAYRKTEWYKWMDFPPRGSWIWQWALKNDNLDTMPLWRKIRVPVLLIYGEKDALVPPDESISRIGAALDASGTPYTALIVPGAQHNLTIQPDPKGPFFWWHEAPGATETVVSWVQHQMHATDRVPAQ